MFLNHWLVARTGDEVVAREVFARFKRYADFDSGTPMGTLLSHVHRASQVYRDFVRKAEDRVAVDRVALFGYRTSVLESEVLKPLVLRLLDPELPAIPTVQLHAALDAVESWMVRRMLVRATSKSYTQVVAELVTALAPAVRAHAGEIVRDYFAGQQSDSRYWPDDDEVRDEVSRLPAYRRLSRGRLRMVLEAIEDYRRGWVGDRTGLGGQRVARGLYAIEHIMPRKWQSHWPANAGVEGGTERDALIHTIGNLTLLTNRLNAKVSNGPWVGESGKRAALEQHDVLVLNRELLKASADAWTDDHIRLRTAELLECILAIWPVPAGHRSGRGREQARPSTMRAQLVDLITAGLLEAGAPLFRKPKEYATPVATVLPDGRVDVSGTIYASPSDAASAIAGHRSNGWTFFVVDKATKRSLRRIRHEYLERLSEDGSDTDEDGDEDDA